MRLLKREVDASRNGGQEDEQRPSVDAESLFAPDRDHGHPQETDGYAGPPPGSEAFAEKTDGQKRGEERYGGDDQARHPRAGGELPVVERHVVEAAWPQPDPYPRATSRVIMTAKPTMSDMAAMSGLPRLASGMSSSATTKIMAPAAKARA